MIRFRSYGRLWEEKPPDEIPDCPELAETIRHNLGLILFYEPKAFTLGEIRLSRGYSEMSGLDPLGPVFEFEGDFLIDLPPLGSYKVSLKWHYYATDSRFEWREKIAEVEVNQLISLGGG